MPRPRDRQSATGLLPRMEARTRKDGLTTYRYHPLRPDGGRGKPINLGTDKALAIRMVLDMASRAPDQGTIGQLWRGLRRGSWGLFGNIDPRGYWAATGAFPPSPHTTRASSSTLRHRCTA